ncbi:Mannosylglycerate hydrolase [Candidatus Calditenuaceae archaeon HR02]|nr:Mannosylglycerate hydrolase [Candidatus Calditenuaceae archaeon HR02]
MATIHLLGHSHIDAVWLWTKDETVKVCIETFGKVLDLMDRYPGLTFCQSSAQYYEWIEKNRLDLFERIRARVREGRWGVVGGSWVEFDCNLPSGESLVRQMLYGKRYFLEKFGVDVEIAWLPDSFGYCWTLPQILAKSGIKYFLTQKLRWNDATVFPYNVFWWRSPDGSTVLSHQTLGSYSESLDSWGDIERQLLFLRLRHGIEDLLVLFGHGDHGGGISETHVDRALEWIKKHSSGDITVKFSTAAEYFSQLERYAMSNSLPVINDELYLQFHRGTYTTQAETKKWNRRIEALIENAEKLAVFAEGFGLPYPREELREYWKTILFYQFHDAICGSSVKEVYEEAERDYERLYNKLSSIVERSIEVIAKNTDTRGDGKSILVFNTQSWTRGGVVELEISNLREAKEYLILDAGGRAVASQVVSDEGRSRLLFIAEDVPPTGFKEYRITSKERGKPTPTGVSVKEAQGKIVLENEFLSAEIDRQSGLITSIKHKGSGREVIRPGEAVAIHVYEDVPASARKALDGGFEAVLFDAWEIYIFDRGEGVKSARLDEPVEVKVVERGPVRVVVASRYKYRQEGREDSEITVRNIMYAKIPVFYLEIEFDWRTWHRLAKLSIPTTIEGEYVYYEIPYGYICRRIPYSDKASLPEKAKHEVPGQRWIDKTSKKDGIGLSILNDCKYGFDSTMHELRVTLLRSPSYPPKWPAVSLESWLKGEEPTDQGRHVARIGLYPHTGDWREAQTIRRAIEFNNPLIARLEEPHEGNLPKTYSFIYVDGDDAPATAVKQAEDSTDIVLRFYEPHGREATVTLRVAPGVKEAQEADLLERPTKPLIIENNQLKLTLKPHEIKTILIRR